MSTELTDNCQRQETEDNSNAACKSIASEIWATQPYKVYEAAASAAVTPLPLLAVKATEYPYNSSVKLNVQVTPVPEVTNLTLGDIDELKQVVNGAAEGLRDFGNQLSELADHPDRVIDGTVAATKVTSVAVKYYCKQPQEISPAAQKALLNAGQTFLDTWSYSLPQYTIGKHAGELMPDFAVIGKVKVLNTKELEALGGVAKLEQISTADLERLGLKRLPDKVSELVEMQENVALTRKSIHGRIVAYTLNPENERGWEKGVWFNRALEFEPANPEHIKLLEEQIHFDQTAINFQKTTEWGSRWTQEETITGPNGKTISGIRSVWQQDKDSGLMRLINLLPPK